MLQSKSYFHNLHNLAINTVPSSDYWCPNSLEFFSEKGPLEIHLPRSEAKITELVQQSGMAEFFTQKENTIIGKDLKDLYSFLIHYGILPICKTLDVIQIEKLDSIPQQMYPYSNNAMDLFYQKSWFEKKVSEGHLQKLYTHLIHGMFPVVASMENQGLWFEGKKKVYPHYRLNSSDSGRLSGTDVGGDLFFNPHSTPRDGGYREKYQVAKDFKLIQADIEAMEMRILADLSGDPVMLDIFRSGFDIHEIIARKLFQKSSNEKIEPQERTLAKAIGFLMVFGGSELGLARRANIDIDRAKRLIKDFFRTFPGVEEWILKTQIECIEKGYIHSKFGRCRKFNHDNNLEAELRSVQNFCVQSPAADISSLSFRGIYHLLPRHSRILLHIHDGGLFSAPAGEVESACSIIKTCMENPPGLNLFGIELTVPLKVKITVSDRWE